MGYFGTLIACHLTARFRLAEAGSDHAADITTATDGADVVLMYRLKKW